MPAFVGKTGRFQPQMRTVVALPPNQQRIALPAFSRLTQACNGKLNQDTVQQARHVAHRILVLVHSLPHRGDDVIYQNIHRMVTAELADFGTQFAGLAGAERLTSLPETMPSSLSHHFCIFKKRFYFADQKHPFSSGA